MTTIQNKEKPTLWFIKNRKTSSPTAQMAKKKQEPTPYGVFDFETCIRNNVKITPYMVGYILDKEYKFYTLPEHDYNPDSISFTFINSLINSHHLDTNVTSYSDAIRRFKNIKETKVLHMYAHNFGRFDINCLSRGLAIAQQKLPNIKINFIEDTAGIIKAVEVEITNNKKILYPKRWSEQLLEKYPKRRVFYYWTKKLVFIDSMNFLKFSLITAAKAFIGPHSNKEQLDFNIANIREESMTQAKIDRLVQYNKNDCRLLEATLDNFQKLCFREYRIYPLNSLTLTAFSYKIFKSTLDSSNYKTHGIIVPEKSVYDFFRHSYKGGRVELFQPSVKKNAGNFGLGYVDFSSLYPAVCVHSKFPGGFYRFKSSWLKWKYNENKHGIYLCKVTFDKSDTLPFLSVKISGTTLFPYGSWWGIYTSIEINKALKLGYDIIPKMGYEFEGETTPFKSFFYNLYRWKEDSRIANNEGQAETAKLLMNSLTGRFGKKLLKTSRQFVNISELNDFLETNNKQVINVNDVTNTTKCIKLTLPKDSSEQIKEEVAPQISSFITAYGRLWLYEALTYNKIRPVYCDTDSIMYEITDNSFSLKEWNKIIQQKLPGTAEDNKTSLGQLVPKSKFELEKIICLAPKFYVLIGKDKVNITCKGITQSQEEDTNKKKISIDLWEKKINDTTNNDRFTAKSYNTIKKNTKNFNMEKINFIEKDLHNMLTDDKKREKICQNNKWTNTRPKKIYVNDEKVDFQYLKQHGESRWEWFNHNN